MAAVNARGGILVPSFGFDEWRGSSNFVRFFFQRERLTENRNDQGKGERERDRENERE